MASFCLLVFTVALALAAPDWTDCPSPCRCTWSNGKKTALCKKAGFTGIPGTLDEGMQVLDLSGNFLSKLPKAAFRSVGLLNLQRVYLSRAGLTEIHRDAFVDLIILVEIDLSDNEIYSLHPETFHGNERLRILYLNGNPLKELVRAQFPTLPHLRTLELENCHLKVINRETFIHLTALETLNLKYNLLQNLSETTFMNFAQLKTLALDGNPWQCDCDLRGFRDWFLASKLHSVPLICSEPKLLGGKLWDEIPSEEFACVPQVFAYPQQQVQAEAGGNVTFGCHVRGDPEPQVLWLYEGHPINHTWLVVEAEEGLLDKWANISIYNVSDADVGRYTCVAKNILDSTSVNVSLVLPEVVTATTLSKSDTKMVWWSIVIVSIAVGFSGVITVITVCCVRNRGQRRNIKASVSFTDQEKKLLDVSIATTTDRGTGSCEALGPELDIMEPPVHITIEREPHLPPLAVYPPPPEFSTNTLPAGAYGNIFISVSVSRDPSVDVSRCPDLLDLPHRPKPVYHGMATLPRRPYAIPQYDNMGPRVTAGGSSTLSLPDASAGVAVTPVVTELPPPPPPPCVQLTPEFVSL
ncbi:leucine-rich repeat, immunoglobulin-like domain and transmembrane domain-containing protein 2 [Diabrotica undecimpunctata]|uniref:leucine-rich repeat, immunoglobulin-like domain and transmembrane domain-containing protein 2 n=1 Tax=Diabrotica undecimpunctata TaxID=50387 RepID=UPI003B638166